jgi:hypothetical protein
MLKTIIVLGLITINSNCFSQTKDRYPLYSDVWRYDYDKSEWFPKDGGSFTIYDSKKMFSKIDSNKINSMLLTSFNNFRKDYNKRPVNENSDLSKLCSEYVNTLNRENYGHLPNLQKITEDEFLGYEFEGEVLLIATLYEFSRVDLDKQDINKIISDSFFDGFIGSPSHMRILLQDEYSYEYGFGISIRKDGDVFICSRAIHKK